MECFILAGGQSRRFGEDKLLYRLKSKRTIDLVVDNAKKVCERVYIVTKDARKFKDTGVPVIEDLLPFQAPIVGIYTALSKAEGDRVVVLSGDMPLLKPELIRFLVDSYEEPVTLFSIEGKLYPLTAVYSGKLLPELESYIESGRRSVVGFLEGLPHKRLTEDLVKGLDPELSSFINMNTKEDLALLLEKMG